jgi:hypothetical protein
VNDIELALRMTADVADVDSAFNNVGSSATAMGNDVAAASAKAEASVGGLDRVAGSADNLDDKAGRATGALGALSAGFELVGMEKYATGLQSASMATDFFSGVGQSATLILESQRLTQIKSTVASARATVVTTAQSGATKVLTVAQRALNIVMRANPIGLAIVAATALVGLFVLLYKRSDTFRGAVQSAGKIAQTALGWVVNSAKSVWEWIGKLPKTVADFTDKVGWAKTLVKGYFEIMTLPARTLLDVVKSIIDFIGKIDFPSPPDWIPGVGRVSARSKGDMVASQGTGDGGAFLALMAALIAQSKGLTIQALDVDQIVKLLRRNGYVVGRAA